MKGMNYYHQLIESHRRIEKRLSAEMKRPMPDSLLLQRLKRRKLTIRDELESWERLLKVIQHRPAGNAA